MTPTKPSSFSALFFRSRPINERSKHQCQWSQLLDLASSIIFTVISVQQPILYGKCEHAAVPLEVSGVMSSKKYCVASQAESVSSCSWCNSENNKYIQSLLELSLIQITPNHKIHIISKLHFLDSYLRAILWIWPRHVRDNVIENIHLHFHFCFLSIFPAHKRETQLIISQLPHIIYSMHECKGKQEHEKLKIMNCIHF